MQTKIFETGVTKKYNSSGAAQYLNTDSISIVVIRPQRYKKCNFKIKCKTIKCNCRDIVIVDKKYVTQNAIIVCHIKINLHNN